MQSLDQVLIVLVRGDGLGSSSLTKFLVGFDLVAPGVDLHLVVADRGDVQLAEGRRRAEHQRHDEVHPVAQWLSWDLGFRREQLLEGGGCSVVDHAEESALEHMRSLLIRVWRLIEILHEGERSGR